MKWHEIALILLANDFLLFGLSAIVEKMKSTRLNAMLDDAIEIDDNIDWGMEQKSLETCYITEDEVNKMTTGQLLILNEWITNKLERKE